MRYSVRGRGAFLHLNESVVFIRDHRGLVTLTSAWWRRVDVTVLGHLPLPRYFSSTPIRKFAMRCIFEYWFMKGFFIHLFQSNQRKCHFLAIFEPGRQFSVSAEEQKRWKIKNWFCHNVTLLLGTLSRCC